MNLLKLLLYPFASIYNGVMRLRNHLYDIGQKTSFHFETAVIAVGNLNVGGSGKTPMVEYLVELLGPRYPTVTLSRGYKRETTGYRIAGDHDTAQSIGDEPLQLYRKFGDRIHVAVGEDRVYAIPNILHEYPDTRVLILDDAMQQRSIRPDLAILVTTFEHPFYRDYVLPFGRLREARVGAHRADAVVVTKCPGTIPEAMQKEMTKSICHYAGEKPVYFACVDYTNPKPLRAGTTISKRVILITGIANAEPMRAYCAERFEVVRHFQYEDHHRYTIANLEEINRFCQDQAGEVSLVTTEKDVVKLEAPEILPFLERWNWFSLPIRQVFLKDGAKFDTLVLETVSRTVTAK